MDEEVSFLVGIEPVFAGILAIGGMLSDGVGDPPVEALNLAIGLGTEWTGKLVSDAVCLADPVEGMTSGATGSLSPPRVTEAVGELGSIVGEHGVNRVSEGGEKPFEAGGNGVRRPVVDDLDMDEAGGPFDGNEDVGRPSVDAGQVLEIDMDETERRIVEGSDFGRASRLWTLRDAMPFQAAMQRRA